MADSATQALLQWRIGKVTVTRAPEYEWPVLGPDFIPGATLEAMRRHPWLFPHFVTEDGYLRFSAHALLVETPNLRVVVDTCFGDNKNLPHLKQWEQQGDFLACLARAGFTRDNVDLVLCTHLHIDHVGWNTMLEGGRWVPTFRNARYLIGKEEYAHWTSDGEQSAMHGMAMVLGESVQPVLDAGLVDFVATDHRLSPELRLTPTPGHTPGHVSLLIESEGQRAVITGDMVHHPCQIAHPEWTNRYDADQSQNIETRERALTQWEADGALVIGTHFVAPTAGKIVREGGLRKLDCARRGED